MSETATAPRTLDRETEVWLRGLAKLCDRIRAAHGIPLDETEEVEAAGAECRALLDVAGGRAA